MKKTLSFRSWQNDELLLFYQQVLKIFAKSFLSLPVPGALTNPKTEFEKLVVQLDLLFKNGGGSILSEKLIVLDARRDRLITGLKKLVEAFSFHDDAEVRAAADLLQRSIDLYGPNIAKQDYASETLSIKNLLKDWTSKPELAGAAVVIGAGTFTMPLAGANKDFEDSFLDRNEKTAAAEMPFKMKDKRAETIAAWGEVEEKIAGFCAVAEDAAPWKALRAEIISLHDSYANTVTIREGRAAANVKKEVTGTTAGAQPE